MRTIYYCTILLFFLIGCCMGAYAETITIPSLTLQEGEQGTVEISMDQAPQGLSGFALTIAAEGSASITGGEGPAWAALKNAELVSSSELSVSAGDLMNEIKPGDTQIILATVMVTGAAGQTSLTATVKQMDDDNGNSIVPVVIPGQITSGSGVFPTSIPTLLPTTAIPTPTPTVIPTTAATPVPTTVPMIISTTISTTVPTTLVTPVPPPETPTPSATVEPQPLKNPVEISYDLDLGWNLIGIPAQPVTGYDTASVFSQVPSDGHSMFQYGSSGWESVSPTTPLRAMDAYWVYAHEPFTVTIQVQESPGSKSLQSGWNLISPAGFSEKKAKDAFDPLSWSYIIGYDGTVQQYDMALILGADDSLVNDVIVEPGHGYWIYLSNAGTVSF